MGSNPDTATLQVPTQVQKGTGNLGKKKKVVKGKTWKINPSRGIDTLPSNTHTPKKEPAKVSERKLGRPCQSLAKGNVVDS